MGFGFIKSAVHRKQFTAINSSQTIYRKEHLPQKHAKEKQLNEFPIR
jgi:hypothetical protein